MDADEAVPVVVRLGLDLAENTERVCPACGGIMRLAPDILGSARWLCRRCGYSSSS